MGSYILMVIVTADQEAAIEDLFQIKGWTYDKTGKCKYISIEGVMIETLAFSFCNLFHLN
jgi:hypothetical protein